jgi:hypothetical protein
MIKVYNEDTDVLIGEITEEQLRFLVGELEEESLDDVDYYLTEATVDMLEADGADADLVSLLRRALGESGEVDIIYRRQ